LKCRRFFHVRQDFADERQDHMTILTHWGDTEHGEASLF
jgi:hypothetical protein